MTAQEKPVLHGKPRSMLALLPGMACDGSVWSPQVASLKDVCDCQIPDYGSARSFEGMASNALLSLPGHFYLAGHSMGARVALEIVRIAPDRVKGLCLISSEARPRDSGEAGAQETRGREALLEIARAQGMQAMGEALLPRLLGTKDDSQKEIRTKILEMIARQNVDRFSCQIAAGDSRSDSRETARHIQCRTLVISGEEDALKPISGAKELASLIPDCDVAWIPGCGHMPMLEKPELVSSLMRAWLVIEESRLGK